MSSLGQMGRRVFGFTANLYLMTQLTPAAMGEFVILQFLTLQIPYWVGMGLNMAIVRHAKDLAPEIQRSAITAQLLTATALAFCLWLGAAEIQEFYAGKSDFVVRYLPWLLALVPLLVIKHFIAAQWQMRLAFSKTTTADLIEHVTYLTTAIVLCHITKPVIALILGFAAGRLASLVYLAVGFGAWRLFLPRFSLAEIRPLLHFGSYVQLGNLANQVGEAVLPIVLGKIGGTDSVGLATWAMRIVWVPQSITNYVDSIAFATFCRLRQSSRRYRWVQTTLSQGLVAFTSIYLMVLNLFFPQLLQYVFGTQWEGSRTMVGCFSLYVLSYSACTVVVQAIFASNGAKLLFKLSFANMIAAWTIGAACIYNGYAKGYGIYYVLLTLYSAAIYYFGKRMTGFEWRTSLGLPLLATLLPAAFLVTERLLLARNSPNTILAGIELAFVCSGALVLHYAFWGKDALLAAASSHRSGRKDKETRRSAKVAPKLRKAG